MRRASGVIIAALLVVSGCASEGGDAGDPPPSSADAIIGGTTDAMASDTAIVELIEDIGASGDDEYTCTATFISKTALLTAAHCVVSEKNPKRVQSGASFRVMKAQNRNTAKKSDYIAVKTANVHPHPGYDGDALHDLAVIVLDTPVDVVPIAIRRTPITSAMIGSPVRLVGYGQTKRKASANDIEARRSVETTIRGFEDGLVHIGKTGQQACDGDSGGPALLLVDSTPMLIATDDTASSEVDCTGGDLYQRVDLHLDFIDRYL